MLAYRTQEAPREESGMLEDLARHLDAGTALQGASTPERVLQGPFADAMTHAA